MRSCIVLGLVAILGSLVAEAENRSGPNCPKILAQRALVELARSGTRTAAELEEWAASKSPSETIPRSRDESRYAHWADSATMKTLQYLIRPFFRGIEFSSRFGTTRNVDEIQNSLDRARRGVEEVNLWLRNEIGKVIPIAEALEANPGYPVARPLKEFWGGQVMGYPLETAEALTSVYDGQFLLVPHPQYVFYQSRRSAWVRTPAPEAYSGMRDEPHTFGSEPKGAFEFFMSSPKGDGVLSFTDAELQNALPLQVVALGHGRFMLVTCSPLDIAHLTVGIFKAKHGKVKLSQKHTFLVDGIFQSLIVSPDKKKAALLMHGAAPWVFDLPNLKYATAVEAKVGKTPNYRGSGFSADGNHLVVAANRSLGVYDTESMELTHEFKNVLRDGRNLELRQLGQSDLWSIVDHESSELKVLTLSPRPSLLNFGSARRSGKILSVTSHPTTGRLAVLQKTREKYELVFWNPRHRGGRVRYEEDGRISLAEIEMGELGEISYSSHGNYISMSTGASRNYLFKEDGEIVQSFVSIAPTSRWTQDLVVMGGESSPVLDEDAGKIIDIGWGGAAIWNWAQ